MNNPNLVLIGSISKPHGIRGEVEILLPHGSEDILVPGLKLFLIDDSFLTIQSVRIGNKNLVFFDKITDRTHWEKTKLPIDVYIERKALPTLDSGVCYVFELIGLKLKNEKNELVGEVLNHYSNGPQIILQLIFSNGDRLELPYIKNFFPEFNLKEGWLKFVSPEIEE